MEKHAENKLYPIQHYVKTMLFISFAALILDFVISFATITIVKQQSARYLQDTADLYIDRINSNFAYMYHFMGWTLANDESVITMDTYDTNDTKFLKANLTLYKRFVELQKSYGQEYNFFLYLKNKNYLLNCAPMSMSYSEYEALKGQIKAYEKDKDSHVQIYSQWSTIALNGSNYIVNIIPYNDRYMIGLIAADDLIRPLRQINLGENGFASLVNADGTSVTSSISNNGKMLKTNSETPFLLNVIQSRTTVNAAFTNASFYVKLVIQFGAFEKIMIAQLLVILLAVIIACNFCFILLYFKKKVLKPIKIFSYNIRFWTGDGEPLNIECSKIIELEKANNQFLSLVKQIKEYKIDIYESELEKQRIQLNYMKLQIKPHFFLNCLTNIYSMAQMQMYAEIQNMTLSTSKYFRYIFQSGQDFVNLEDEIEHARIYLEIQKHRYRNAFDYKIEQIEYARGKKIPPLVLQTFIENAIKYAVSRENEVQILLTVDRKLEKELEMTVIRIADTGPGFSANVLENLIEGHSLDQTDGTHIGIMNTLQRLEYLYHNEAIVRFSNVEGSGACVVLYLPEPPKDKL